MKKSVIMKLCSILTILAMCTAIFTGPMWADAASTQITTPSTGKIVQVGEYDVYVPEGITEPGSEAQVKTIEINTRITVTGDVHLILA